MSRRYSTADDHEAQAAAAFLREQGFDAQAETGGSASSVLLSSEATVEAVELLLRRAPAARPLEDRAV